MAILPKKNKCFTNLKLRSLVTYTTSLNMIFPDNIEKENEPGDTKQTKENLKHFTTDVIKCFSKQSLFGDEPANL